MKKTFFLVCSAALICVLLQIADASELMTSARQIGMGRFNGVAYASISTKEVDFGEYGKIDFIQEAVLGKLSLKVWGGWHVYLKAGKFTPIVESTANSNKVENMDDYAGTVAGGGIKWVIMPDTIVTPAITVDVSGTNWDADLDKTNFGGSVGAEWNIKATEIQGVVMVSKKLLMFDPYGGVKVFNTDVKWNTTVSVLGVTSNEEIEGDSNGISPFVGVKFSPFPFISIVVEGSVAQEENISAGISVGF